MSTGLMGRHAGPRAPLPDGAVAWSTLWMDSRGVPQQSADPVPVDGNNQRTLHVLHTCPGKIEVGGQEQPCDQRLWLMPGARRFCPDHGAALAPVAATAPKRPGLPWRQVWDIADERFRVAGVTATVGAAGLTLDLVDVMPWWGYAAQVAAMPTVVASSWWLTRWWMTRKLDPADQATGRRARRTADRRARIAAYAAALAAGWISFTDLFNATGSASGAVVALAALAGVGVVASRPYRAYVDARRRPAVLVEPAPAPPVVSEPVEVRAHPGLEAAGLWVLHERGGALPHTVLVAESWREVVGGWGIIIRATKPGAVSVEMLTGPGSDARLRVIAGTFGINRKFFNFVEQDDPNDVLMLVQPDPPLAEGKTWLGPESIDVEKGVAHTGFYIDGTDMYEPFYRYGWGSPSKIVTGTTGSGKSENLRKQLVIERYFAHTDPETGQKKGLFASFLHDFKDYESYGEFQLAVHAIGSTVEDAYIMRNALIREMRRRYRMLSSYVWYDKKGRRRRGGRKWDPRIHGPILSWTIDEFHEIAKDPVFIGPLELLARKMRACGIRIVIGTHMGTLGDTGSRGLRDMLAGGYALLGRTTDALTSVVTGGQMTADPRQLPKLPGMCLVADGDQATMHARQTYIPSEEDEPMNVYDLLFDDSNQPIGYPAVLPPETLEAFGPEWVAWAEAGRLPDGRPETGVWSNVETLLAVDGPGAPPGAPTAAEVSTARESVLAVLLTNGEPMDIDAIDSALKPYRARGVRCSVSMARKVLAQLVDERLATKPNRGQYQIAEDARERLAGEVDDEGDEE